MQTIKKIECIIFGKKPIVLAINKADSPKQEMEIFEFYNLGIGDPVPISAASSQLH